MERVTPLAGAAVAFAIFVACGSDDAGTAAPPGPDGGTSSSSGGATSSSSGGTSTAPSSECLAYADGYCTYLSTCAPVELRKIGPDVAGCAARVAARCAIDERRPGALPHSAACSAALKAAACTGPFLAPDPSCHYVGTLPDGASCYEDFQCQTGRCEGSLGDSVCGKCGPPPFAANGACKSNVGCPFGMACTGQTCRPFAQLGEPCDWETQGCVTPLRCYGGTCIEPFAEGLICSGIGDPCDVRLGLRCDDAPLSGDEKCQKVVFGTAGTTCNETLLDRCDGNTACPFNGTPPKKCEPIADNGQSCRGLGGICAIGAECKNGVCTIPPADHCK